METNFIIGERTATLIELAERTETLLQDIESATDGISIPTAAGNIRSVGEAIGDVMIYIESAIGANIVTDNAK